MDDVALSVGAALLAGSLGSHPSIIDVFSVSNYTAASLDSGDTATVTKIRKDEEHRACRLMGAEVRFLDVPEIQIRGPLTVHQLNKKNYKPKRDPIYRKVATALRNLIQTEEAVLTVFPLGLGGHVEHRLLNVIGRELISTDTAHVAFYEDLPYASLMNIGEIEKVARRLKRGLIRFAIPGAELENKIDLLRIYESQVEERVLDMIRQFHATHGPEHLWGTPSSREAIRSLREN
jgi:LmbE family N-acetylglucosaminyl deacetylase